MRHLERFVDLAARVMPLLMLAWATSLCAQTNCIEVVSGACVGECHPVTYIGAGSPTASYQWSISCGTITNPNEYNPHIACFDKSGICTIKVIWQERGQAPDSCTVEVVVYPKPKASLNLDQPVICKGTCTRLNVKFTGTPPYTFFLKANNDITRHLSDLDTLSIEVCPEDHVSYEITVVTDEFCTNDAPNAKAQLTVVPPFIAEIRNENNVLCATPVNEKYRWFLCGGSRTLSSDSCYAPDTDGCYCVEVYDDLCSDTVCFEYICDLSCAFSLPHDICTGDSVNIRYLGSRSPALTLTWIVDVDQFTGLRFFNVDSLALLYTLPGTYSVRLVAREGNCIRQCVDTVRVIGKPCTCDSFNTNSIKNISSGPGGCCYEVGGHVASPGCFQSVELHLSSGTFTNVAAFPNWSVSAPSPQVLVFQPVGGFIIPGNFNAGAFCVTGAQFYTIDVYYHFGNAGVADSCSFRYVFDCPWPPDPVRCDSLFSFLERQHTIRTKCCYNLHADNPYPTTFQQIHINLNSGNFVNPQADQLGGFSLLNAGPQSLTVVHNSGFIPAGVILPAWFCLSGTTNPVQLDVYYVYSAAGVSDSCGFRFFFDCPDLSDAECCDSLFVIFKDAPPQPFACCWDFELVSNKPKCFSKCCISASSGTFSNIVANPGWTASQTPNGICFTPVGLFIPTGLVAPGSFCLTGATNPVTFVVEFFDLNGKLNDSCKQRGVRECFSGPPPCSCDSLKASVVGTSFLPGQCCYDLNATIPSTNCFQKAQVLLSAGNFANAMAGPGYTLTTNGPQDICFTPLSGFFPQGNVMPGSFCVMGATVYTITVHFYYSAGGGIDTCTFRYFFDCPPPPPVCRCDSLQHAFTPLSSAPGVCCYAHNGSVPSANCFTHIDLQLTNGSFANVQTHTGWVATLNNPQSISIHHASGFLPAGNIHPVDFCVAGATTYQISATYYINSGGMKDTCIFKKTFDCPFLPDTLCLSQACPGGMRSWQNLATGLSQVYDMVVYQCRLIVAGQFTQVGTLPVNSIAAWDGANWYPLAQGVVGTVYALAVHNGLLYAGGMFQTAGSLSNVNNLAAWNGSSWLQVDNGVTGTTGAYVTALLSTSSGLVVGGNFQTAGSTSNLPCQNIALWNGAAFVNNYNATFNGPIYTLGEYGGQLVAGGTFTTPYLNIASWNGSAWNPLSGGITLFYQINYNGVASQVDYGGALIVGGHYKHADNVSTTQNIARWNGSAWSAMPGGDIPDTLAIVNDFLPFDNKLYVGGEFTQVGLVPALGVAEWTGTGWNTTGHTHKLVRALAAYDSCGTFPCDLYAAGEGFLNRWICLSSTNESANTIQFRIYPNPAGDHVDVHLSRVLPEGSTLHISDLQGRVRLKQKIQGESVHLQVEHLLAGTYIISVWVPGGNPAYARFVRH
jgi:hypothetical protein